MAMRFVIACALSVMALTASACGLFSGLFSDDDENAPEKILVGGESPREAIDIIVDKEGIPHAFAADENDAAYALGFMHGKDRLFQLEFLRHAAQGRITELFGRDFLDTDEQLRFMVYRLRDEERMLDVRARGIYEAYALGVNDGAERTGQPAELRLLRRKFNRFTVYDALSIYRLFSWRFAKNMHEELARSRIRARLAEDDPRREALSQPVPTLGTAVLQSVRRPRPGSGDKAPPTNALPADTAIPPPTDAGGADKGAALDDVKRRARQLAEAILSPGASTAWAVVGSKTKSGAAVLAADPHFRHAAPSTMYLAHLTIGGTHHVTGGTFPGVPAIFMGYSDSIAYAFAASHADTQDAVRISVSTKRDDRYVIADEARPFGAWMQTFMVNGQVESTDVWKTTIYGPVLPKSYSYLMEPGQSFALQWTGFYPDASTKNILGYWDVAKAKNAAEAKAALDQINVPSMNAVLAFSTGEIAHALVGRLPQRAPGAPSAHPTEGENPPDALWVGLRSAGELPAQHKAPEGFLAVANQRLSEDEGREPPWGYTGDTPHRAERLYGQLRHILGADKKPDAQKILSLQQDVISTRAKRLAPILGKHCPKDIGTHNSGRVAKFCEYVSAFKGRFSPDELGALPFVWFFEAFMQEVLTAHVGEDLAIHLLSDPPTQMTLERAMLEEDAGTPNLLLDDYQTPIREGLAGFAARAAERALDRLVDDVGSGPTDWKWGELHTLTYPNALAATPLVGGVFQIQAEPEAGSEKTLRRESGLPVQTGAVMRMVVEMSDPPRGQLILDLGQSGSFGADHFQNMRWRWRRGELIDMARAKKAIEVYDAFRIERHPAAGAAEAN